MDNQQLIDSIQWNEQGLIVAIAQEIGSRDILMQAWINKEALKLSLETGYATYWSRSRQQLWRKGETSGHLQKLVHVHLDCDSDSLLFQVEQMGGIACHTGAVSCYFKPLSISQK